MVYSCKHPTTPRDHPTRVKRESRERGRTVYTPVHTRCCEKRHVQCTCYISEYRAPFAGSRAGMRQMPRRSRWMAAMLDLMFLEPRGFQKACLLAISLRRRSSR